MTTDKRRTRVLTPGIQEIRAYGTPASAELGSGSSQDITTSTARERLILENRLTRFQLLRLGGVVPQCTELGLRGLHPFLCHQVHRHAAPSFRFLCRSNSAYKAPVCAGEPLSPTYCCGLRRRHELRKARGDIDQPAPLSSCFEV